MKTIKDRRNIYAALFTATILLAVLLIAVQKIAVAIICGALAALALILLYRQNRLLGAAMLIFDSSILTVPSCVVISENISNQKQSDETIVSTFGLLLGSKVYKWGCEGVYGVRLRKVQIDKEHICLSFGDDGEMQHVELLHGLPDKQSVTEITQKLWRETGIQAEINNW